MSSKFLRFPMRATVTGTDAGLAVLAAEEIGYGICLSLYFLAKPRVRAVMHKVVRTLGLQAKPEFANSSFLK